ncbi:SDR family oxidoreductase [Maricurvus nonylphenolicus]|uniref:SDR family oxidoreductase n=1 Tax=Maricurvus nonylphenolicus TaxID=1008307 RepID=UPI0036F2DEEF
MEQYPVAIITGASRGIGRACAIGLAQNGYQTILVARSETSLLDVANEINEKYISDSSLSPIVFPLDLTELEKIEGFVKEVIQQVGRVDVLVNNAGLAVTGSLDVSISEFERASYSNLFSPFALLKEIVPIMRAQGSGYIFNIASQLGKTCFAGMGAYGAAKSALIGLNDSLFRELSGEGISVTAICPGWVNTDMAQEVGTPFADEDMIQPEDIMKTISWLLEMSPAAKVKEIVLECKGTIS